MTDDVIRARVLAALRTGDRTYSELAQIFVGVHGKHESMRVARVLDVLAREGVVAGRVERLRGMGHPALIYSLVTR